MIVAAGGYMAQRDAAHSVDQQTERRLEDEGALETARTAFQVRTNRNLSKEEVP